ncbi:MAG: type II toxin-antitoxin system VapC family toxin [Treponema sp.]|jgi:predicted nucleic acid-binding protein|nr:type II toxin-antitoxin system VapC family toxin [Treponema sp.]
MIIVLDSNAAIEVVLKRKNENVFRELIEEAGKLLELPENLIDEFIPISEHNLEALNEAIRLDYSAHDMLYLTLARRTGALLITLDQRLNEIARQEGIEIVHQR